MNEIEKNYRDLFDELQKSLNLLKKKLDQHRKDFRKNPNLSFVGDIKYINEQTQKIIDFTK